MTLFDPDEFRSPGDNKDPKRKRSKRTLPPVTPSDGRWHVIARVDGPIPRCHRIDPFTPGKLFAEGSVLTLCNIVGRRLETPPVGALVYACANCKELAGQ